MPRIFVAIRATGADECSHGQWIEVDDAAAIRRRIAELLRASPQAGTRDWCVLAYDGLPDFGPQPIVDDLLAYLDAVDEYGEPFETLWASRHFESVIQAADVFADTYQATYANAGTWARHYLALIGAPAGAGFDFDAYGRAGVSKGDVTFIAAHDGGIHVFWND